MPEKIYHIQLSKEERSQLQRYVRKGKKSARSITRAHVLLLADNQMVDEDIAETLGISLATVYRIRKSYHQEGLAKTLKDKPRSGAPSKVDGRLEAQLTMLACSDPPEGHARWTQRLLADKLVSLDLIDTISHVTIGKLLKKTNSNLGSLSDGA